MLNWLLNRLEEAMGGGNQKGRKVKTFRWLIIVGCLGLALMILSSFFSVQEEALPQDTTQEPETQVTPSAGWKKEKGDMTMRDYEELYETQLSEVLNNIVGVDDVKVMVNLDSSEETVVEKDTRDTEQVTDEADTRGGNRKIHEHTQDEKVVLRRNGNGDQPIVVKKLKPRIRGVLVVAKGAENLKIKAAIIDAVQRVLDVPIHRISVLPKG
ncbi:stage III sporulation protein AG [Marinithermofilum abyssi]|uniref:Stage III sporulation protein AG n=1 Tax=Marinithermofilum abyssi TaxID=1571185 RepID=A0A8J2VHS9_9BACL|nr:stage III sporulation protein AG [Marinithermofilum abyssi]GGE10304.1 stage III sporulation protein AG [Marinithermofilum abyssi]